MATPWIWLPLNGDIRNNGIKKTTITNSGANNNFNYYGPTGKCWCSYNGTTAPTSSTVPGFIATGLPLNNFTTENISFSTWVRFPSAHLQSWLESGVYVIDTTYSTPQTTIIGYGNTSQGGVGIGAYYQTVTSGVLNFTGVGVFAYIRASNGGAVATTPFTIPLDKWCHLTSTYDTQTKLLKFYVNGELIQQTTWNGSGWNVITTDIRLNYANVWAGNGKGVFAPIWMSDARIYNEVLSDKEIYNISKGLAIQYTFDVLENGRKNLIINGFGNDGTNGWSSSTGCSSTELYNDYTKLSFTANNQSALVPINPNHKHRIMATLKSDGTTSGNCYPSLLPYDYDKLFIYYHMSEGLNSTMYTTLSQDLNPGDTVIHATNLSGWTTAAATGNNCYMVAIYGYHDSSGHIYPDFTYTRDSIQFGTSSDKSHLDIANNTITLNNAFTGQPRPAGTTIGASYAGSTYFYPFGGIAYSTLTDWVQKTYDFIPSQTTRLKCAKYIRYMAYGNAYHANIQLIDYTLTNKVPDSSGMGNDGCHVEPNNTLLNATGFCLGPNNNEFSSALKIGPSSVYEYISVPQNAVRGENLSSTFWYKPLSHDVSYQTVLFIGTGPAWNNEKFVFQRNSSTNQYCFVLSDGTNSTQGQITTPALSVGTWYHIGLTFDNTTKLGCLYVNGELVNSKTLTYNINFTDCAIRLGRNSGDYYQNHCLLSDFRIYGSALNANDIKNIYNRTISLDNKNKSHSLLLKENTQNKMWQSALGLTNQQDYCLRRYTQTYCAVTHTSQGAHIVRTPNITYDGSSNGTYGGIVFRNTSNGNVHPWSSVDNIYGLQKNHRYIFLAHLKGYSANNLGWITINNNVGWSSGGLTTGATINSYYYGTPLNTLGSTGIDEDIWMDFTITDDIVKTCTTSYSSFTAGNKYLSYAEFGVGFTYGATGELGTDIYVSNPRLYDITEISSNNFNADGTLNFTKFNEYLNQHTISINKVTELLCNEIIER